MSTKGSILRLVNRTLRPLSVKIQPVVRDYDNRLTSQPHRERMLARLAEVIEPFLRREIIFPCKIDFDLRSEITAFYDAYVALPERSSNGGSRFSNLLWLYLIGKGMHPELQVDSGTFTGLSSWALSMATPDARTHSFDLDLSNLLLRSADVSYHEFDWSEYDFGDVDPARSLCYFDDHLDQVRRLLQASERGFRYLIFDDDVIVSAMPFITSSPISLPKLQFIYDDSLVDGEELEWVVRGLSCKFRIDRGYMDQARDRIEAVQKLPDIWAQTGVMQQNPYTLVVLRDTGPP